MDEINKAPGKALLICPLEGAVEMLRGKHCIERAFGYHGHLVCLVLTPLVVPKSCVAASFCTESCTDCSF